LETYASVVPLESAFVQKMWLELMAAHQVVLVSPNDCRIMISFVVAWSKKGRFSTSITVMLSQHLH